MYGQHDDYPQVEGLLHDQRRAYDIIDWHLNETLNGNNPEQLLMIIPGEGGVGKSKTIQTITENFVRRGASALLAKSAYTGIAASIIDGKTLHVICQIPLNGRNRSRKANKKLAKFWQHKRYLIIDEKSMLSRKFFARISSSICSAKILAGVSGSDLPFGGVNVILVGDFHQFPPVMGRPLYWPIDPLKDDGEELLGRSLYERFKTVVRLTQQVRVIDEGWLDVLRHVRYGSCRAHHLQQLRSLIITNSQCPPVDFFSTPWNDAVLVTPRHAVRRQWNSEMALKHCRSNAQQLFICAPYDTVGDRPVTLSEKFAIVSKRTGRGSKNDEQGGLPDEVMLGIGMKVMVTFNVETDLDVANGARGEIIKIVLDENESNYSPTQSIIRLKYPPVYVLIRMKSSKVSGLEGLEQNIIPLTPMEHTFLITQGSQSKTVVRKQLPLTTAYAFTDYRSQGQTIQNAIIDIASPPTGTLTPFNIYVALSRSRGREGIRLLRDFDEKLLTRHPSEFLRAEDERLARMNEETENWWKGFHVPDFA